MAIVDAVKFCDYVFFLLRHNSIPPNIVLSCTEWNGSLFSVCSGMSGKRVLYSVMISHEGLDVVILQ